MSTKALMSVEEYLRTSFEDIDCDYVDGVIEERHLGERGHAWIQMLLGHWFMQRRDDLGIEVLPEIRVQIDARRYRVADVAVWRRGLTGWGVPAVPPFLVVEILSPEDRMVRVLPKIADYLRAGVQAVWLIDPEDRRALAFTPEHPTGQEVAVLRVANPEIAIPLIEVLPPLTESGT